MLPGDELADRVDLVNSTDIQAAWHRCKPHDDGARTREGVNAACSCTRSQARSPSSPVSYPLSRDSGRCLLPHHASIHLYPLDIDSHGSASTGDTSLAPCRSLAQGSNYPDPGSCPQSLCTRKRRPHSIRLTSSGASTNSWLGQAHAALSSCPVRPDMSSKEA